jgi:hypothetical protein
LREDCPELTLEWAAGLDEQGAGHWIKLWDEQGQTAEEEKKSRTKADALPYRNLRNEKWDRVNGVFDVEEASVPVKRSVRAFLHDGIGRRNYQLRQFIEELFHRIVRIALLVSTPISKLSFSSRLHPPRAGESGFLSRANMHLSSMPKKTKCWQDRKQKDQVTRLVSDQNTCTVHTAVSLVSYTLLRLAQNSNVLEAET